MVLMVFDVYSTCRNIWFWRGNPLRAVVLPSLLFYICPYFFRFSFLESFLGFLA